MTRHSRAEGRRSVAVGPEFPALGKGKAATEHSSPGPGQSTHYRCRRQGLPPYSALLIMPQRSPWLTAGLLQFSAHGFQSENQRTVVEIAAAGIH